MSKCIIFPLISLILSLISIESFAQDTISVKHAASWIESRLWAAYSANGCKQLSFSIDSTQNNEIRFSYKTTGPDGLTTTDHYTFYVDDLDSARIYAGFSTLTLVTQNKKKVMVHEQWKEVRDRKEIRTEKMPAQRISALHLELEDPISTAQAQNVFRQLIYHCKWTADQKYHEEKKAEETEINIKVADAQHSIKAVARR